MATLDLATGNIRARCPGCEGALSSFEWSSGGSAHGHVMKFGRTTAEGREVADFRLFKCGGCGCGAWASISYKTAHGNKYPGTSTKLIAFHPEVVERLAIPPDVPDGIRTEFREGESCLDANCIRAAAGMFRSVLDKTLRANGYKLKPGTNLEQQIDLAAADGVITEARRLRAHDEIRVLGNDVLHDEWHVIDKEDVLAARHYSQRILEDFYDDRPSTLKLLRSKGRVPHEDKAKDEAPVPPVEQLQSQ